MTTFSEIEKQRARKKVAYAIKTGTLTRPTLCDLCKQEMPYTLQAHHWDYSKPLWVSFYCGSCHKAIDMGEPKHGSLTRYASAKWHCRCDECRKAGCEYARQYYLKRKGKKNTQTTILVPNNTKDRNSGNIVDVN